MAWSIVGVGAVVETTGATLTLTEPAGVVAGDLLVAFIAGRGYNSGTTWCSEPSGWTATGRTGSANILTSTSALASGAMLFTVRGASAPVLSFTLNGTANVAMGRIVAYRGGATTAPLNISAGSGSARITAINTTAVSLPGLTTTLDNTLIVAMCAGGQEATWSAFNATSPSGASGATDTTTAPSATWRERADSLTTTGSDTSLAIFDAVKTTAGATGNLTATASLGAGHVVLAAAFKIAVSGAYTLPAVAGSYELIGADATLTKSGLVHRTLAAAGSTYALTGTVATLTKTTPPTADAWNKDDKSANVTLSASDKTATLGSAVTGGIRSTQKYLNGTDTGKYYAEFLLTNVISGFSSQVGIREVSAALNSSAGSTFQCASNSGNILTGSATNIGNIGGSPLLDGDVICMAWSPSTERGWFRKNGNLWNNDASADPATNTNGLDISVLNNTDHALFFLAASSLNGAITTLHTELAEYTQAVPSGFTSWMGELPPRVLPAVAGSYALSGATASLEFGREVAAVTGSYAVTGATATFRRTWKATAIAGSYTLTGTATAFARTWRATAVSGAYALTGLPANLLKPGAYAVAALPGSYALTGATASLVYTPIAATTVVADSGSYALTGSDATLTRLVPAEDPPAHRSIASTSYASRALETVCSAPSGVVDGDILIAGIFAGRGDISLAAAAKIDIAPPVGWTQIGTDTEVYDNAGFTGSFQVYWKRASGEGSDYTFSHTGTETTYSTQAVIAAYSGCAASGDPIDLFSQNVASTGSLATATGIVTTIVNTKLVYVGHNWNASGTLTAPAGTERFDHLVYLSDEDKAVAGATGDRTQTLVASNPWSAFLVALKPEMIVLEPGLLQVDGGSYALTGAPVSLAKRIEIGVDAGAYTLSGQAVTLRPSAYRAVEEAGSYVLTGSTAPRLIWSGETRTPPVYSDIATTSYASRTNTTVSKPVGALDGDILLAAIVLIKSVFPPGAVTAPTGWSQIDVTTSVVDEVSTYAAFSVYWKRASSEPDDYTFLHDAASSQAQIVAYADCVPLGIPIDDHSIAYGNSNNHDALGGYWNDYPSVTTTDVNSKLVMLGHSWDDGGHLPPGLVPGPVVTMTERFDSLVYTADEDILNPGATGLRTMQQGQSPFGGLLIVLKPLHATPVYSMTGLPGTYGLTGVDAFIEGGLIVLPGSYALTGQPATLIYSGEVVDIGFVGVWTGSAWVDKPAKVWTGSAWVQKPVKVWNGSTWELAA